MRRIRATRKDYYKAWRKQNRPHVNAYKREHKELPTVIGIDGEGITENGIHRYTYLAAWTSDNCISVAENSKGLSPTQVFEFLLAIKQYYPNSLLVGFSLGYDYTKWFEQLPTRIVYLLARPEARRGRKRPRPVKWKEYSLNYLRGRFSLARLSKGEHVKWCKGDCYGCIPSKESLTVWDALYIHHRRLG